MVPGDELERDEVVVLLGSVPERVSDLVMGLDENQLRYRHAPAFPTLRELATHLSQAATSVDGLLRQILIDGADRVAIRAAIDPPGEDSVQGETPLPELLEGYARIRRRTIDLLRGTATADWERRLTDAGMGDVTLLDLTRLATRHEIGHLTQVRNLIAVLPEAEDLGPPFAGQAPVHIEEVADPP